MYGPRKPRFRYMNQFTIVPLLDFLCFGIRFITTLWAKLLFRMPSIEINKVLPIDSLWTMRPLGGNTYMRKDTSYCQRLWPLRRWELAKICCGPFLGLWISRRMCLLGFGSMEQEFWHTGFLKRTKSRCHFLGACTEERIWRPIHQWSILTERTNAMAPMLKWSQLPVIWGPGGCTPWTLTQWFHNMEELEAFSHRQWFADRA